MKKKLKLFIILLLIVSFSVLIMKHVVGKYLEQQKIIGNAQIAKPIFVVEGEKKMIMDKYNTEKEYNFYIRNYTEEEINDVAFQYVIDFQTDLGDSVEFYLEKDGIPILLDHNRSESIFMNAEEKTDHVYHLKIEAKEEIDEIAGNVNIKVLAEQVN